jgi:hypothetical protein
MDLNTALMLSAATISAGGAFIACIQAERAARAERLTRDNSDAAFEAAHAAEYAADRAEAAALIRDVAELRELAAEHIADNAPLLEALTALQARLSDAAPAADDEAAAIIDTALPAQGLGA